MKNGLFLLSIGCLIVMLSVNLYSVDYDLLKMVTGLTFIISGIILSVKNSNQDKSGDNDATS